MKQKLLNKTLRVYIIFSLAVLIITAPVFYWFAENVQQEEAGEALLLREHEFEKFHLPTFKEANISQWNEWNRDIKIEYANKAIENSQFSSGQYPNILDGDLEPYRTLHTPILIEGKVYTLFIKVNLLETEDMIFSLLMLYIVIVVLLLTGLFVITKRLSTRLWKPFTSLLGQLEHFEISKPANIKYSQTNVDEFERLNMVIEKLINRNIQIFNNQKEFLENAAHELQTPLAVMQAKLDNLIQSDSLTPEIAEELEILNNSLSRLGRINKNLLLLSRIDKDNYPHKQPVSVNEILNSQLNFFKEQYAIKNIIMNVRLTETLSVTANAILIEVCTSNLLMNAIKHTVQGGKIDVTLHGKTLDISNTATEGELSEHYLFKRFAKISPNSQGAGLGLAIVKKIADLNQWQLTYTFQNNQHIFSITF